MNNMNNEMDEMDNMNNEMSNELWQDLAEADSEMLKGGILISLLLPAVQAAREAARNSTSRDEFSLDTAEQP
ncbi:MAG: hypothetical protein AAF722_15105 [Cyanobacteria bacterium P01_C01_bin.70]